MQYFIAKDTAFYSIEYNKNTVDDVTNRTWNISSRFGLNGSDTVPDMTLIMGHTYSYTHAAENKRTHTSPSTLIHTHTCLTHMRTLTST